MATSSIGQVVHHLRRAALVGERASLSDGQLLECYINQREEAAFTALVRRHGAMVWGVCRRVLGHHHDAEEAFQATFLVLVRKAASVQPRDQVGNWLYGVATNTAIKARAMSAKRKSRERQVLDMPELQAALEQSERDWQPVLDQELSRMADKYRVPIVLCDLQGKSYREAAQALDLPEGTLAARLSRGRTMLAQRLRRHGVALAGGVVASLLAQQAPAAVMSRTIEAATLFAAGHAPAGAIAAEVVALTEGVLTAMLLTKLKIATAILMLIGVLGGGLLARGFAFQGTASQPARTQQTTKPTAGENSKPKDEKDLLRGTWKVVRADANGPHLPREVSDKQVVIITDERLTIRYEDGDTWQMKYQLFPAEKPKGIDLTPANGLNKAFTMKGSYELAGKGLKLCFTLNQLATERPKDFDIAEDRGRRVYILEKAGPEPTGKEENGRKGDLEKLQGAWLELKSDGEVRENGQKMVFTGTNFTWGSVIDWEMMKGPYTIDAAKKLKELDFTFTREGKVATGKCIYILEGDLLKVCYSEPDRPTRFKDTSPNFPRVYFWKRQKPDEQQGKEKDKGGAAKDKLKKEISTFSPDGSRVAVAADKSISMFDVQTGKELARMLGHNLAVTALAFSPDGKLLASGSKDKMVCVWDGAVGRQLLRMQAPSPAKAIQFSGDGRNLIVHEADQTIREYEIATGKEVRVTKGKEKQ